MERLSLKLQTTVVISSDRLHAICSEIPITWVKNDDMKTDVIPQHDRNVNTVRKLQELVAEM